MARACVPQAALSPMPHAGRWRPSQMEQLGADPGQGVAVAGLCTSPSKQSVLSTEDLSAGMIYSPRELPGLGREGLPGLGGGSLPGLGGGGLPGLVGRVCLGSGEGLPGPMNFRPMKCPGTAGIFLTINRLDTHIRCKQGEVKCLSPPCGWDGPRQASPRLLCVGGAPSALPQVRQPLSPHCAQGHTSLLRLEGAASAPQKEPGGRTLGG